MSSASTATSEEMAVLKSQMEDSKAVGIHLHHTMYEEHSRDYIIGCDNNDQEEEEEENKKNGDEDISALHLGCLFILRCESDEVYSNVGHVSYRIYPMITIQNLLAKPIDLTLHDDNDDDTSLDSFTTNTMQPGQIRKFKIENNENVV